MGIIDWMYGSSEKSKRSKTENYENTQIFSVGTMRGQDNFPSGPRAELTVIAGNAIGMKFPLIKGINTIGRKEGNDICLQDPNISRIHARIELMEEDFTLIDVGSTNGTFINGKRVVKAQVKPGDNIKIGKTELRFHVIV